MRTILLINGPNLNLLGEREPDLYGRTTLAMIEDEVRDRAARANAEIIAFQSNHEGDLVDFVQQHGPAADGAIINAGAYTHTSVALRDAISARSLRFVEVHLSNVWRREEFRHQSYLSDIACGVVAGLGHRGYLYALDWLLETLEET